MTLGKAHFLVAIICDVYAFSPPCNSESTQRTPTSKAVGLAHGNTVWKTYRSDGTGRKGWTCLDLVLSTHIYKAAKTVSILQSRIVVTLASSLQGSQSAWDSSLCSFECFLPFQQALCLMSSDFHGAKLPILQSALKIQWYWFKHLTHPHSVSQQHLAF